jgi:hypothetical protein
MTSGRDTIWVIDFKIISSFKYCYRYDIRYRNNSYLTALKRQNCYFKGTVSPDYKCLEVISIKSPLLGHVTPDI